ncbi:MAG: LapD/MoxY N-terminal periplasmic domain-containing protein [Aliiglaciecola sp.]|uniref:bifunctional diguanylate cyclase/phosphodiesterase n=1 Tax=Aliiglaciecola sp. TaxID=1872441 RepID=UPI003297EAA9
MYLSRQLWLSIVFLLLISSISNFFISISSARDYFEQQLYVKNVDDTNSLAMLISNSNKDLVDLELLISAKFDTGHFLSIVLINAKGDILIERQYEESDISEVPSWFIKLADIKVKPGVAQINDGWQKFGTLYIESQTSYAYQTLWDNTQALFINFIITTLLACLIGSFLLRFILVPLDKLVEQARAFSERRFFTIPIPYTKDFARVVKAMNTLADRFKGIVLESNKRLDQNRYKSQHDRVTGLININAFFTLLEGQLRYRDKEGHNILFMVSISNYDHVLATIGQQNMDAFLVDYANTLNKFSKDLNGRYTDIRMARLNDSDFAVLMTESDDINKLSYALEVKHRNIISKYKQSVEINIAHAAVYLQSQESSNELFNRLDELLEQAQQRKGAAGEVSDKLEVVAPYNTNDEWGIALTQALDKTISTMCYPVVGQQSRILHHQAMIGLELDGKVHNAGYYAHKARALDLVSSIDLKMIETIIEKIKLEKNQNTYAILLSIQTILDKKSLSKIYQILSQNPDVTGNICLELRESVVFENVPKFRRFCSQVKELGCQIGLKRVGASFSQLIDIQEFGLDYIKIDSAFVFDVSNNKSNQEYLTGLCNLAHSLGMTIIADGVTNIHDEGVLMTLGFDGYITLNVSKT